MRPSGFLRIALPLLCSLLACTVTSAQSDLPPGILKLSRLNRKMAVVLDELPAFSCLETISRSVRNSKSTRLTPLDTLRLEVGFVGGKEVYSWPGVKRFNESSISDLIGVGLTSNGEFAAHARNIFVNRIAEVSYVGEEALHGHSAAKYRYRIPSLYSAWRLTFAGRSGLASSHGLFWVDTETLDLLRLEIDADQIPPDLPVKSVRTQIDYSPVRLGGKDSWIPQTAQLLWEDFAGSAGRNDIAFSHCRTFSTDTAISFGDAPPRDVVATASSTLLDIPGNVSLTMQLDTPIDSARSSAGDEIRAIVKRSVVRNGQVVVPEGAVVSGRIRRLERYDEPRPHFVVGLEFTEVAFGGKAGVFLGRLESFDGLANASQTRVTSRSRANVLNETVTTETEVFEPVELRGVGTFIVEGDHFVIDDKFHMTWRTQEKK